MKRTSTIIYLLLVAGLMINADSCCNPGTSEYVVVYQTPTDFDLALTPKNVGVDVTAPAGYHTTQILLNNWFAGHNTGAPAHVFPVDFQGNFSFSTPLPQSGELAMCDGMYYFFTISYTAPSGNAGVYIGDTRVIQPASQYTGPNTIEQGQCGGTLPPPAE